MFHALVELVDPVTLPELAPSSTVQRSTDAGEVVHVTLAVWTLDVIVCAIGSMPVTRGPSPPDGLTTSALCVSDRG